MAFCIGVGYAAYTLAGISWDAVVSYKSLYASEGLPASEAGSAVASRTVLVIVDGLRADAAKKMGTLSAVRQHGSSYTLTAPQPSLSFPNWTTILTGAPPYISGVTTNWHEGAVPVESIFDTAKRASVKVVFSGTEDFEALYGVRSKTAGSFMKKWDEKYLSAEYVDAAISLAKEHDPALIVVHLPDVDEAGHAYGGRSGEYSAAVSAVDADLGRLVSALQDGRTAFVVVSDHGHIDTGGHGGWEPEVVHVPFGMAGPGVRLSTSTGRLESVAASVAYLSGVPVPRYALYPALGAGLGPAAISEPRMKRQFDSARLAYAQVVGGAQARDFDAAQADRLKDDRMSRLPLAAAGLAVCLAVFVMIALASWRMFVSAIAGTAGYYALYNLLFFVVHGNKWSLSSFNSEDLVKAWMNTRMVEAAASVLFAAAIAAVVYRLLTRNRSEGPSAVTWLVSGPVTAAAVLASLGAQIAWFVWAWGAIPVWRLPDLMWGFKYDLDLIQATAVGFSAIVTPAVALGVGRLLSGRGGDEGTGGPAVGAPLEPDPLEPAGGRGAQERELERV